MRDERLVITIGAALKKRLGEEVAIIQGPQFTEWRVGDKGFAVGPTVTSYPPRKLLDTLHRYMTPPMPVRQTRATDEESPKAKRVKRKGR